MATTLCNELTLLLKMDQKWRSGYEHFLKLWTIKIQELESIEDTSTIDNQTKCIWHTATPLQSSNSAMRSAICQTQTTQVTPRVMNSTSPAPTWSSLYNMLLSTAKQ